MSRRAELQVLFCGVGGQGVLRAADVLGRAFFAAGNRVNLGQLHGMSQRGGSVSSFVLVGPVDAALLDGPPDLVVALEPLEGARAAASFGAGTTVLVNTHPVVPYERTRLGQGYPDEAALMARSTRHAGRVRAADVSAALAPEGLERAVGVAMLGALSLQPALVGAGLPEGALASALGTSREAQRAFALGASLDFAELPCAAATQHSATPPSVGNDDGLQARH